MIQLENNTEIKSKYKDVDEVMDLIKKNYNIAKLICNACLIIGMHEDKKNILSHSDIDIIMYNVYESYAILDEVEEAEFKELLTRWKGFDTHKRGNFLEQLILFSGAYTLTGDDIVFVCESKVYHEKIKSNHNFDAIFYNSDNSKISNDKIEVSSIAEYYECKNNICKWLPCSMKDFFKLPRYKEAKRKLLFIKKVHKIIEKKGYFYIPTLAFNVSGRQDCLNKNKFGYIKILSIQDIIDRYYND